MARRRWTLAAASALLIVGPVAPSAALDPLRAITQYTRDSWQTEHGLPQHSVQAIEQTRDGYLWLGTQEGLVRFDGVRFTVFDKKNTPALLNNNVQGVVETRDGTLWITTGGGGLTRLKDGVFTTYTMKDGLSSDLLGPILEDEAGALWIGTSGGGLNRYRDGGFTRFGAADGLPNDSIHALATGRDGSLWVGTDGGGLVRMKDGRLTVYRTRDGLSSDTIYAVYEDAAGVVWIGTGQGGLNRFADGRFTVFGPAQGFPGNRVEGIVEDRQGNLWVATYGAGLVRHRDGVFASYGTREGLSSDILWSVYEDAEGSLWVGTRGGGLDRLRDGKFTMYTTAEGLPSDTVWGILEDAEGALWIATDGGGLARMQDGRFRIFTTRDGLTSDLVRSLAQGRDGSLWIGTWGGGLNRLKDGRFTSLTTKQGLSHDIVRAILEDRDGSLWIGTYGGGVNRLRGGRLEHFGAAQGLSNQTVYCILQDRAGRIWVGTRGGGLNLFDGSRFRAFTRKDGLSDDIVLSLYEDDAGELWVGTRGGVNRWKDGRFSRVSTEEGLFDDVVYVMLDDGVGNVWMSSNKGVFRVSRQQLRDSADRRIPKVHSIAYGRADGMKSSECNGGVQPAGFRTREGRLWFPTIKGVASIDPRSIRINQRPPPVHVEEVLAEGSRVAPGTDVPPGHRRLEFHFTALSLRAPGRVRFQYRLDDFDPDWTDSGPRRVAYYTNVPYGTYTFRVRAANEDGVWNEEGAARTVRLLPRVYETTWFRLLGVLALASFAAAAYAWRVQALKSRERDLVLLVEARTRDLKDAGRRLEEANAALRETIRLKDDLVSIVAHDFRSPLTLIHGYAEVLESRLEDPEAARMSRAIQQQSQHLARLAEDTLTLSRVDGSPVPLDRAPLSLADLAASVATAQAEPVRVRIAAETGPGGSVVSGDRERLYQVLDNLIGNALKYSPPSSAVEVGVRREDGQVVVSVADHGYGIAVEDFPRLFQRFTRLGAARGRQIPGTGLGLYICRCIVEAHGGRIWAERRSDGSTFHFSLPAADGPGPSSVEAPGGRE